MTTRTRLAVLLVLGCAAVPSTTLAQGTTGQSQGAGPIEVTAIAGYQVNTDIDAGAARLSVEDTPVYGAALGVATKPGLRTELMWLYSDPTVRAYGTAALNGSSPFHVATHYFQIGGTQSVRRQALEIFGGGGLGAALFMPGTLRQSNGSTISLNDTWRFAFSLGAGVKLHASPKVALRLETRVAAPVYFSSGGVYAGSGGAGITVSGGIPLWQWNFFGGLVFTP